MNISKNKLVKFSAAAALSIGMLSVVQAEMSAMTSTVEAAVSYKVVLVQNAYVYNAHGKCKSKTTLKEGTTQEVYGSKQINGTNYLSIGKGRYIKQSNTVKKANKQVKKVNIETSRVIYIKPNGKARKNMWASGTFPVKATVTDNKGNTWYRIGKKEWINTVDEKVDDPLDHNTDEINAATDESKNPTVADLTTEYKLAVEQDFVKLVNDWRNKQGLNSLMITPELHNYAVIRADEAGKYSETHDDYDNHIRPDGTKTKYGEVEAGEDLVKNPMDLAEDAFNRFVYWDANSNWAHRENLRNPNYTKIGVSVGYAGLYANDPHSVNTILIANLHY